MLEKSLIICLNLQTMIRASSFGRRRGYFPISSILNTKLIPPFFSKKKRSRLRKSRKLNLPLIWTLVIVWVCLVHLITKILSIHWQSLQKKNICWELNFEVNHIFILQANRLIYHLPLKQLLQENQLIIM
jgi:hypothetical protein